jgi:NAD(P)-dependent dehydrogenase (short-subunit alcohol dehydrogenase family)
MSNEPSLEGQTLVVIGGSSGIGLETARQAHAAGAAVVVTGRNAERVHTAGIELDGSIAAFDATDFNRLGRFFDEILPSVDHVVVAAPGSSPSSRGWFDVEAARRDVEAHVFLPLEVAGLARSKLRPSGSILFLGCTDRGSLADRHALVPALTASLSVLTRSAALELAPIRVNLITAGFVDVQPTSGEADARGERLGAALPIRRVVIPRDVAALAVHLMKNTAVTGATFEIDGGQRLIDDQQGYTRPGTYPGASLTRDDEANDCPDQGDDP